MVKELALAMLADRLSGLLAILIWSSVLIIGIDLNYPVWEWLLAGGAFLSILIFYWFFPMFRKDLVKKILLALLVQGSQMAVILILLMGMGIQDNYLAYLLVFLVSSVATIIPVTIGGLGLRELVFLHGAKYLGLDATVSVAVSLIFFLITLISSLPGLYLHNTIKKEHWTV